MFNRLKNVFYWLPVIWKDHNFDYEYIFIILRHKLQKMRDDFRSKDAVGAEANKRANEMELAIEVLDRLTAQDYIINCTENHDKKWGDIYWENGIKRYYVKTEKDKIQEAKEYKKCCELADLQEKQDLDYLFKLLRKHIYTWWD